MRKPTEVDPPHEFHRRRAEVEMERALAAAAPSVAMLHLELAQKHREFRNQLVEDRRDTLRVGAPRCFNRTDKES